MEERSNILSEINSIAPAIANIGKGMPFSVPEGYFEMLPVQILGHVIVPAKKPAVPEGYFDSLPGIMLGKIKQLEAEHELKTIAPTLVGINRQMPYSLPANYFETLEIKKEQKVAPVVSIQRKSGYFKLAIAATVVAIAGIFAWQMLWNSPADANQQPVANTTDSPASTSTELASALAQLDDASLHAALYESGLPLDTKSALYYLNTENFEKALREFTDEELRTQLTIVNPKHKS
jgi:hypothetical protein